MDFEDLPPDIQREIINWCIKEKVQEITHEKILYKLPNLIQLTYYCEKDGVSFPTRIYSIDLISDTGFSQKIRCKLCKEWIYLISKSAPTPHIISGKPKEPKKGLSKFI